MANLLFVSEFSGAAGGFLAPQAPSVDQTVVVGVGSTQSNAFAVATTYLRLVSNVSCSVAFGTNPTALATNLFLPANVPTFIGVPAGKAWKVATIASA